MSYFPFYTFVLDCETTGIDPARHTLLSVGGVLLDGDLNEVDAIEVFIKHHDYVVEPDALAVNKIDLVEHDRTADRFDVAGAKLVQFFAKHRINAYYQPRLESGHVVLAGWNVSFDVRWLYDFWHDRIRPLGSYEWPFVSRQGGGPFGTRMIDIYSLAVAVTGEIKPHSGLAHSALADARAEADQYREIVKQLRAGK